MADELRVVWILAIGLSFACCLGYLAQQLKLSPILGYLLAGYFIGPNFPGFIADQMIADQLANIGVALLMFVVGLNFNWKDINAVKNTVVPGALFLSFLSIIAGVFLSISIGESLASGLIIGIAVSVSSTVVILRMLTDQKLLNSKQGHVVIGWTIIEDLISVFGLIMMPSLIYFSTSQDSSPFALVFYSIVKMMLKILLLAGIVYFFGERLIVRMLKMVARTRSHELFTLAILASVLLIAVSSTYFFGISLALGAFIAGTIIGNTELNHQATANALPLKDAFAVIFFLSVGMLFDPRAIQENLFFFFGILLILLVLRPLIAYFILKIQKQPSFIGLTVAISTSQIGEYSFILAEEGERLNILPENAFDIIVACSLITIVLNPIFFNLFKNKIRSNSEYVPSNELSEKEKSDSMLLPKAIVIGFGPVGQSALEALKNKNEVIIIDQNIDTVSSFKEGNIKMLFGDAAKLQILERADILNAVLVVITVGDLSATESIIKTIQSMNPYAKIIARVYFKSALNQFEMGEIPVVCDEVEASLKIREMIEQC